MSSKFLNLKFNYNPLTLTTISLGRVSDNQIEIFTAGNNANKTQSFIEIFNYNIADSNLKNTDEADNSKKSGAYFSAFKYSLADEIKNIIPIYDINLNDNLYQKYCLYFQNAGFGCLESDYEKNDNEPSLFNYVCEEYPFTNPVYNHRTNKVYGICRPFLLEYDIIAEKISRAFIQNMKKKCRSYLIDEINDIIYILTDNSLIAYHNKQNVCKIIKKNRFRNINVMEWGNAERTCFYTGSKNGNIELYDVRKLKNEPILIDENKDVQQMIYNSDNQRLYFSLYQDYFLVCLDREHKAKYYDTDTIIEQFCFDKEQKYCALRLKDNTFDLLNLN